MTQSSDEDVKRVVVMFPALAVKVIGVLVSILVLGGSTWLGTIYGQVKALDQQQKAITKETADQKGDLRVMQQQINNIEKVVGEVKDQQKETGKKLDELLRRVR